jgi:hypothetical protein
MPTPEQPSPTSSEATAPQPDGTTTAQEQAEQHFKTIAVRIEESVHSQLSFIAQLSDTTISKEIRQAIDSRITNAQADPELIARATAASERIEREAAARTAAIAGFIGKPATTAATARPSSTTTGAGKSRRGGTKANG